MKQGSRLAFALTLALGASVLPSTAFAVRSNDALGGRPEYEDATGGDATVRGLPKWDKAPSSLARVYSRFLGEFGPGWRASFDTRTGVPSRLFGPGLAAPNTVADPAAAEAFARAVLERHIALFAPMNDAADFELVSNDLSRGMRTIGFVQKAHGVRVVGGQVSFRFRNDRLFMIGSEALPGASRAAAPRAADVASASKAGLDWVESDFGLSDVVDIEDVVMLPHRDATGRLRFDAAVPIVVTPRFEHAKFRVYVDVRTNAPIARRQLYHFASSNVRLHVPERAPAYGNRFDAPALLATVVVGGVTQKTDELGAINWVGPDPTSIQLTLNGDRARVFNDAGPESVLDISLADAAPYVWDGSSNEQLDAELTAYHHAGFVREYARSFAPTLGFLNQQVRATVNIDDLCNAFSDGTTINFFRSGQGCENTGRIADVVYHEYGHSIHDHAIIEGVGFFEGAVSEGVSDYLAATITGDPKTARGFFMDTDELRDIDPAGFEHRFPDDLVGEVHEDGLIIAGALWDLRKNLVDELGETEGVAQANILYYEGIRRAVDMPSMYPEVLAADDDDGDVTNGTPHVCSINEAFDRHGLRPVSTTSSDLGVVPPTMDGYTVRVSLTGLFPQCPGDAVLGGSLAWHDRADPSSNGTLDLELDGTEFTATIPEQPSGTVVKYGVDVELDGRTLHLPDNEADPEYEFFVGDVVELYCTDFETDPFGEGWTHGLTSGDPDEGADDWAWDRAKGDSANGDPPEAYSGNRVIGNDLTVEPNYNGLYQPDKVNYALSPAIDLQGYKNIHIQYRRWLNVEDAFFDQGTVYANNKLVWQNLDSEQGDNSNTQHRDKEWRFQDVNVSGFLEESETTLQVKFELSSDGGLEFGGWTLDDFCIVALEDTQPCDPEDPICGEGGGGQGGNGGTGGDGQGGGADDGDNLDPDDDDGCGCAVPATEERPFGLVAFGLLALGPLLRRRSGRRAR